NDQVYLSYPPNKPPQVGQRYSIYQPDNAVKSNGKEVGAYVHLLGTVEVQSVRQDKRARGVIVESNQEIERGAKVGPLVKAYKTGQDDRRFPARALGEIVVVEVGDNMSVGLVTLAVQEMGAGDIVMMQKSGQ